MPIECAALVFFYTLFASKYLQRSRDQFQLPRRFQNAQILENRVTVISDGNILAAYNDKPNRGRVC